MVDFFRSNAHVIWLTGLSGAGKTSIAAALANKLTELHVSCFVLDGDELRAGLNSDLGFTKADRFENIRRIAQVAKLIASRGDLTIVAAISPKHEHRHLAKRIIGDKFLEVFVNTPLSVCEARDPKGLYQKARKGEIKSFTGVSEEYEPPQAPDIVLRTDQMSVAAEVEAVLAFLGAANKRENDAAK